MVLSNVRREPGLSYRTAASFALAIAIVAVAALLVPGNAPPPPEQQTVARVLLVHPAPTSHPTATPTPPPPIVHRVAQRTVVVVPKVRVAAAAPVARVKIAATHPPELSHVTSAPPVAQTGSRGTGGTGNGQTGTQAVGGDALPAGQRPCGEVSFSVNGAVRYDRATQFYIYDNVSVLLRFPDGSHQSVPLDYPWRYKDEAGDPFAHDEAGGPPTLFEFPPPALRAGEPPVVQYVMAHTSPEGFTLLESCPAN